MSNVFKMEGRYSVPNIYLQDVITNVPLALPLCSKCLNEKMTLVIVVHCVPYE